MLLTQQCKAELREGGSPYILQEQSKYPRVWRKDIRKKREKYREDNVKQKGTVKDCSIVTLPDISDFVDYQSLSASHPS
jgi:hypothetical protein